MRERIAELYPDATAMDGYDECIVGICHRFGQEPIVAYDYDKVIEKMIKDGMTEEEALEFYNFNQIGAWVGETTPCFIENLSE